jgi:serine phosphatase RsbU (regulator of sigma subunit)/ligand-binding sensor domain-containing protein
MSANNNRKIIVSTIACLFLYSIILKGQVYNFKNFRVDSKLPNNFIYTLNQGTDGFLWVGTGIGLSRFDGFDFHNVPFPDSVITRYPATSLKDKNGTLWFGCSDGTVFYTQENKLKALEISNSKSISDLLEGSDGFIYVIPQGGAIYRINPIDPGDIKEFKIDPSFVIFSGCFTSDGKILIGTQENLKVGRVDKDSLVISEVVDGFDYSSILSIQQMGVDKYIIGTDGNGLFILNSTDKGYILSRFSDHPELELLRVQSSYIDYENALWISTFESGIYKLQISENDASLESVNHFNKNSGLTGNNVKSFFQDMEGNFWIGFFGDGLSLLSSYAFSYFAPGKSAEANNIIYVNKTGDDYLLGTPSGYHIIDLKNYKSKSFVSLVQRTGNKEIACYNVDDDNIWVGTKGNGLYSGKISGSFRQFYRSGNSGEDFITDIETDKKNIWLATLNGVIIIDKSSGAFKQRFNIDNGLPHNSVNQIFLSSDGNCYIATEGDRLYRINPDSGVIAGNNTMTGNYLNKIISVSQSNDGVIWAATYGNGVFKCHPDSVASIAREDGLMSNYCYSVLVDINNIIWIGHERGFSQFNPENGTIKVFGSDFVKGGVCNSDGMYESSDGKVLIGTTEGLIVYDRAKDKKDKIAPFNNINYVSINDVIYPYKPTYSLPYKKRYALRVSYVGIFFSDPDKVYYSTLLENYDNDWTRMSAVRDVPYSLGDGKYRFNLISVNEDGLSQDTPISFEINIKRPVWRTWWFILLSFIVLTGVVIMIIRERDKAQKKIQAYLEKELEARTRVVMKQKDEIELQNLEITDSINYAKRIQSSILPDINRLKETFKDAFILFQPRDIVSGDYYWFDKLEDDKFILVCADSTGHGVPGAFMSMIGSTLLQDIVTRKRISKPSQILTLLDKQIFSTLNQNVELGVSNDGMDMVVCEFDLKTRYLRFSSAMRPVIIVLEGEPYYIKGNRCSIGGESVIDKYFDDQEYYLNEGDTIYMFSDGLPDQFGGTDGRKMKIARFKKLIEKVSKLPMNEQQDEILKFYTEWKGNYEQVDDILIMGVRV